MEDLPFEELLTVLYHRMQARAMVFCYAKLFEEPLPRLQSCKTYSALSMMPPAACRFALRKRLDGRKKT